MRAPPESQIEDLAAVDVAVAGDHGVAEEGAVGQAEIGGAVGDETVDFGERAIVHQRVQPLPGGHLAPLVLLVDATLTASQRRLVLQPEQVFQTRVGHGFFWCGQFRPPWTMQRIRSAVRQTRAALHGVFGG